MYISSIWNMPYLLVVFLIGSIYINPIQDGLFWGCSGMAKRPHPKICYTYPTMMKPGTFIPYLKRIRKIYESREISLDFCWYQHFFTRNQPALLYQEIQIWTAFRYIISDFFNFSWAFKDFFNKYGYNFDDVSKSGYCRPS